MCDSVYSYSFYERRKKEKIYIDKNTKADLELPITPKVVKSESEKFDLEVTEN